MARLYLYFSPAGRSWSFFPQASLVGEYWCLGHVDLAAYFCILEYLLLDCLQVGKYCVKAEAGNTYTKVLVSPEKNLLFIWVVKLILTPDILISQFPTTFISRPWTNKLISDNTLVRFHIEKKSPNSSFQPKQKGSRKKVELTKCLLKLFVGVKII